MKIQKDSQVSAYISLWFVVFVWGITPLLAVYMLQNFAPTVTSFGYSLVSCIALFFLNFKHLRELNWRSFRVALITGTIYMSAATVQKIGLQYTSPANFAFLENLSCAVVPFAMWAIAKKRPTLRNILTVCLCLVGAFILTGVDVTGFSFSVGDLLCAAAGVLYGLNIAVTAVYAKHCRPSLFIMMQQGISAVLAFGNIFLLSSIRFGGEPLVPIYYTIDWVPLLAMAGCAIIANAICWTLRTKAVLIVNPTAVAVIMPTSAVITAVLSVLFGTDALTWQLVIGGGLGFGAALLASFDGDKKQKLPAGKKA